MIMRFFGWAMVVQIKNNAFIVIGRPVVRQAVVSTIHDIFNEVQLIIQPFTKMNLTEMVKCMINFLQ